MATDFEQKIKGKEKVKFKRKFKGDLLRKELKDAIKEAEFRESKDRPKTLKRGNVGAPKGMNIGSSLGDLKKEFKNRFGKEEIKPSPAPQQPGRMQPLSKGGRAGYKSGTRGCKLAKKGKGRAYGKNS